MNDKQTNAEPRRVVITGMGLISPLGSDLETFWDALYTGQSGVGPLTLIPQGVFPVDFGAEASEFTGKIDGFGELEKSQKKAIRKGLKVMCRECQMGVAAAQRAINHAGITFGSCPTKTTGVSFGSDYMITLPDEFTRAVQKTCEETGQFEFGRWAKKGLPQLSPLWLLKFLPNMPASHIAIYNDFQGPSNSITVREASADLSVGEAFRIIAEGRAEIILAGATGTRIHPVKTIHSTQHDELATDAEDPTKASRPFDRNRSGMVLGEGAGAVILESLESAQARGATIYGEIVGRSASVATDRNLVGNPRLALKNALRIALDDAGLTAESLGHLQAHGLSTRTSDAAEAAAICEVLGSPDQAPPVTTVKGHTGNLGAGSGVIELIAGLLALKNEKLFPVLNYETADPDCPVRVVTDAGTPSGDSFVHLSITPQGQAAAVAVRRFAA